MIGRLNSCAIACAMLVISLPALLHSQTRTFSARQFVLDDALGDKITLQTPAGPFSSYVWTLPSTAPAGATAATPAGSAIWQTLYWDGTNWATSSQLTSTGLRVGIGTNTPFYGLHRRGTLTSTFPDVGSAFETFIQPTAAATGYDYGIASEAEYIGAFPITSGIIGMIGFGTLQPTATIALGKAIGTAGAADLNSSTMGLTDGVGVHGEVANMSSNTITNASALEGAIYNTGGGTITNARGVYLTNPFVFSGSIGNYYGIYQENLPGVNRWPYWYSDGAGGALVQITNAGRVGIGLGVTAPGYPLDLASNSVATTGFSVSSNFDIKAQPSAPSIGRYVAISALAESNNANSISGSGYVAGIRSESQLNLAATAGLIQSTGVSGLSSNYGAQTLTSGVGLHGEVRNFDVGVISTASALETAIFNVSSGTITDAKIIHVMNPNVTAGSITNAYGLYVDDMTSASTNYPIYVSNGAGNARFAVRNDGKVGIGTDNPSATLEVAGSIRVGTNGNIGNVTGIYNYSATLDFPSTSAQSSTDYVVTATGSDVVEGDAVIVRPMSAVILPNSSYTAWVSGPAQITIRFNNYSSSAQDPASGIFKFTLIQH
jgi:hypothetical protein